MHARTYTHIHTNIYTYTHIHPQTYTHTYTHAHIHTHTHTLHLGMGDCFVVCSVHKRVFGWSEGANFIKICICAAQYYTNLKLYSSDSYSKVISDVCSKYSGFNQNIGWSTTGTSTNSPGVRTLPEHLPSHWCDTPTTMAAAKIKKLLLLC